MTYEDRCDAAREAARESTAARAAVQIADERELIATSESCRIQWTGRDGAEHELVLNAITLDALEAMLGAVPVLGEREERRDDELIAFHDAGVDVPLARFITVKRVPALDTRALAKAYDARAEQLTAEAQLTAAAWREITDIPEATLDVTARALSPEAFTAPVDVVLETARRLYVEMHVADGLGAAWRAGDWTAFRDCVQRDVGAEVFVEFADDEPDNVAVDDANAAANTPPAREADLRGVYRFRRLVGGSSAWYALDDAGEMLDFQVVRPGIDETHVVAELVRLAGSGGETRPMLALMRDVPPDSPPGGRAA